MAKKGFFGRIFGSISGNPPLMETEQEQVELQSEKNITEQVTATQDLPDAARDSIKVQGALLELWNLWSGDDSPPDISILAGKNAEDLHVDEQMLEREKVRLALQLEKDAQKRLEAVKKAETGGQSLDAF